MSGATTAAEDEEYQKWKKSKAGKRGAPEPLDADALQALVQKMQRQIAELHAAQGVPTDPIDAAVKALIAHVGARKAANPQYDFSELEDQLKSLDSSDESITSDESELLRESVLDHSERYGQIRHDMAYVEQLSRELHKLVLKEKVNAAKPIQTDEEDNNDPTPEDAE